MELKYFTPQLKWITAVADEPSDPDPDPQIKGIAGGCTVTATIAGSDARALRVEDLSPEAALLALSPIESRLDDGVLKLNASTPLRLVANSPVLELPDGVEVWYTFRFHHVTYNGQSQDLPEITITAPFIPEAHDDATDGQVTKNLATAEWISSDEAVAGQILVRNVPDDVIVEDGFIKFMALGEVLGNPLPVPAGIPGGPGPSAYQVAVAAGFVGTVSEWLASLIGPPGGPGGTGGPGPSAYQVAVANGFVGSETAWLTSLIGEPGPPGTGNMNSVVAGTNIDVDNTDPANPVVSVDPAALDAKLDKVSTALRVYATDGSGAQTALPLVSGGTTAFSSVWRDANGRFQAAAPSAGNDVVNKTAMDTADALKVDKVGTANRVYIVDGSGVTTVGAYSSAATVSAFVRRDASGRAQFVDGIAAADAVTKGQLDTKEATANKGAVNGYAPLDASATVPAVNLPSYVDDVLEYANLAAMAGNGVTGKIFVALDTNKTYRWSGSAFVEISPSPGSTDSVTEGSSNLYYTNARADARVAAAAATGTGSLVRATSPALTTPTGIVKGDVGLGNVDNTSDATKNLIAANTQTASYTLVLGDAAKAVEMNVASANNLTVPPNSSVAFPVGTVIEVLQYGAGQTTVVAGAGVTIRSPGGKLKLAAQYGAAALRKRATDEWVLEGNLAT